MHKPIYLFIFHFFGFENILEAWYITWKCLCTTWILWLQAISTTNEHIKYIFGTLNHDFRVL